MGKIGTRFGLLRAQTSLNLGTRICETSHSDTPSISHRALLSFREVSFSSNVPPYSHHVNNFLLDHLSNLTSLSTSPRCVHFRSSDIRGPSTRIRIILSIYCFTGSRASYDMYIYKYTNKLRIIIIEYSVGVRLYTYYPRLYI